MRFRLFISDAFIVLFLALFFLFALQYFRLLNIKMSFNPPFESDKTQSIANKENPQSRTHKINTELSQQMYLDNQESLLKILNNKALHYASYKIEFEGKVISVDTEGGKDKYFRPYKISLIVGVGEHDDKIPVFFPEEEVTNLTIIDSHDNPITINDLKKNDHIIITLVTSAVFKYNKGLLGGVIKKQ